MKTYKEFSLQIIEATKPKKVPKDSVQDDLDELKELLGDLEPLPTLPNGKQLDVLKFIRDVTNQPKKKLEEEYLEENFIVNWLEKNGWRNSTNKEEAYKILNKVYKVMYEKEKKKASKRVSFKRENEIAYRENRRAEDERRIQQNRSARARLANKNEKLPSTANKQLVGGRRQ